jgi:ankyrin repeat protein
MSARLTLSHSRARSRPVEMTDKILNDEFTPLLIATWRGDEAEVARLLAAGANVHDRDDFALYLAARRGHDAVVARLLAAGADVHANRDFALYWAAREGRDVVVARLLAAGADVHANNGVALYEAARQGHDAVVARLLAAGADEDSLRAAADKHAVVECLRLAASERDRNRHWV